MIHYQVQLSPRHTADDVEAWMENLGRREGFAFGPRTSLRTIQHSAHSAAVPCTTKAGMTRAPLPIPRACTCDISASPPSVDVTLVVSRRFDQVR